MLVIKKISLLQKKIFEFKKHGKKVGFVPTMGALHEGHLSLVRRAKKENDIVVVSIFVNPLQFGPKEDFRKYPRSLKKDAQMLKGLCDIIFAPSSSDMYSRSFCSTVEVKSLSEQLCGSSRPGHFIGVTTIVAKLFNAVMPNVAYFGQKDAQQAAIISKMVSDLNFSVAIKVLPIIREKDGLAMSSRNVYLSQKERQESVVLYQSLKSAERMTASGIKDACKIKEAVTSLINRSNLARIDYIEIVDKDTFEVSKTIEKEALLLLAVYIGVTRLIDNAVLKAK